MKVEIKSCIDGVKKAKGIVVIIDVLRASSTITTLIAQGTEFIIPVETIEEALKKINQYPEYIVVSDKKQFIDMGHYDNSPTILSKIDLTDKKIIHLTTNGTRGIVNAKKADEVLVGCFLNAKAIFDYLNKKNVNVTLVPMGDVGKKTLEDELCASYINNRIEGKSTEINKMMDKIRGSKWAKHLIKSNKGEDVDFCLSIDKYNVVPKLIDGKIKNGNKSY